jgi:hypothetical protein
VIQPHAESILRQEASIRKRLNKLKLRERKKSHGCAVPGRAGGGGRAHDTSTTSPSSKSETASRRDDEGRGGEDGMRVSDAAAASDGRHYHLLCKKVFLYFFKHLNNAPFPIIQNLVILNITNPFSHVADNK